MGKPIAGKKEAEAELRQASSPAKIAAPPPEAAPAAAPPPPVAAPAPVYATPPKARRGDLNRVESEDSAAWEADKELAKAKAPAGGKDGPSVEESVRKADRLYASQDWAAAAAAYRDLLNRFPGHKDAAKWRERVSQSLIAQEQARKADDAKAAKAKAKSSDALK
jgi:hypothetical protein